MIGFPRGAAAQLGRYAHETGVTALGVDIQTPAAFARAAAPAGMPLQGNLDPQLLIAGGAAMEAGARQVIDAFRGGPHIFNLGHGITPETPPENVAKLVGDRPPAAGRLTGKPTPAVKPAKALPEDP